MSNNVIEIRKAEREGARLVIGIAGVSGSGKTFTALQLAWGMANGDASKIGFLDTENRRGSLYSDILVDKQGVVHQFLIGDLFAPFSPDRYKRAIEEFQAAGVEVLIVDSVSHEWEGAGGCQEIAANTTSKMADWKKAKAEHKRFMNTLLQSDMHIIPCIRAREKTDFTNPKEPKSLGLQPIQEGNFMFEMTAAIMMHDNGLRHDVLKCPAELLPFLGRGEGYITARDGVNIRRWVDGAKKLDPAIEAARNTLQTVTERGAEELDKAWKKTPAPIRKALGETFYATLKASAEAYDQLNAESQSVESGEANTDLTALNTAADNIGAATEEVKAPQPATMAKPEKAAKTKPEPVVETKAEPVIETKETAVVAEPTKPTVDDLF